jgi:hypothetical protein
MAEDFEFGEMQPEGSRNRTFVIVAAALGGLVIVSLIVLALYTFVISPRQEQQATNATETSIAMTSLALAQIPTETDTPRPTSTAFPTETPTLSPTAEQPTEMPSPEATRGLLITPTPAGLPDAGFADDVGLPGLVIMGLALIGIVIITRRVRVGMSD